MAQICLIRTEGKAFASGPTLSADRFVELPALSRESKTHIARATEASYNLGNCLYFYAGHACPEFGDVVLLFDSHMADQENGGSATPFDTGGLHEGHINVPSLAESDRSAYCDSHSRALNRWLSEAEIYIENHFESPAAYVLGARPLTDDPTGRLLQPDNSRRAWTWEVRIHRDHELTGDLVCIWMSADYFEAVRQSLINSPNHHQECQALMRARVIRRAPPGELPHAYAEQELSSWL